MTEHRSARCSVTALLTLAGAWSTAGYAEQLLAVSPLVQGSLASATAFNVPGAGTVTVTLTDLDWPAKLQSLTFAATTPTAVVASLASAGQTSFGVGSAGVYDAVVNAVASPQSFLNMGWYSLTIDFAAAVPLPPTALLMLSGLGCLAGVMLGRGRGNTLTVTKRSIPAAA
jgi:hypothetical protein